MKTIPFLFLLSIFLFGAGCATVEQTALHETAEPNATLSVANETTNQTTLTSSSSLCTANWTCIDFKVKAYRLENCSFSEEKRCPLGCVNGTCRTGTTCTTGFKCRGEYVLGFQTEGCGWTNEIRCEWGCFNASCNAEQVEPEPAAAVEAEEPVAVETYEKLSMGESKNFTINGAPHTLKVYNIDADKTIIDVDQWRSDWLEEGDAYSSPAGFKIVIKEILFQSYPGGIRRISFKIE